MTYETVEDIVPKGAGTPAELQIRDCLINIFKDQDPVTTMLVAGQLIEYFRDDVLSSVATLRRGAAAVARSSMAPRDIAEATGLSRATVSRLITEYRNV